MTSKNILAIDFGTSNSLVGAICNGKKYSALPLDQASADPTIMRTLLYFPNPDKCYYGAEALNEYIQQDTEGRLFRSFKSHLPNQSYLGTAFNNRLLPLETLVGYFLLELKKRAEKQLGSTMDCVVMGRPARYSMDDVSDQFAVHRMKKAARFAGFKQIMFTPEPLAAAFDYRQQSKSEKTILIGDFGGGTSDFTIMKIHPGAFRKEDVLAIDGCPLAGDSLDSVFMAHNLNKYFGAQSRYRLPMGSNLLTMPPSVVQRLNLPAHIVHLKEKETYEFIKEVERCALTVDDKKSLNRLFVLIEDNQIFSFFEEIEKTKKALSKNEEVDFKYSYPEIEIVEKFKRSEFNIWAEKTQTAIHEAIDRSLYQSQLTASDIDLVCLTGGTSYVPLIREDLQNRFGREKLQTQSQFHSVLTGLVEVADLWNNDYQVFPAEELL